MDWAALLGDYTLRTVALGTALTGAVAGSLGVFALLRRQSLLGDAVSHAALPGVALAFLLTLSKEPLVLVAGALVAGWLATWCMLQLTNRTRLHADTALGVVMSVFFGLGLVLLTYIQSLPTARQAGLDRFLFGSASTMLKREVLLMAGLALVALTLLVLLWNQFKLLAFDQAFAQTLGWPVRGLELLLTTLIVLAIVVGLQAVGVVLMSALVVAPAAAARQWSDRLVVVVLLAATVGAVSGAGGTLVSSLIPKLPTGPAIVLLAGLLALGSLLLAPARGVVWAWLKHRRQHRQVQHATVLAGLLRLAETHADPQHPHDITALDAIGLHSAARTMPELAARGLARREGQRWGLTAAGVDEARRLLAGQEGWG